MNKKNLFLLVTTLFLANGFVLTTKAMEPKAPDGTTSTTTSTTSLPTTSLSTTSSTKPDIEEIDNDDVPMSDVKEKSKTTEPETKDKKRKREEDADGKALEKRSNVEQQQVMLFDFGANNLSTLSAFFNNPASQMVDSAVLKSHAKTLVSLIKTHQQDSIRVLLPLLTKLNNKQGQTFLHLLAMNGNANEIKYLFDNFDEVVSRLIDALDVEFKSALHYAVTFGHDMVVKCLLENDAAILLNDKQFSLMHYAAKMGFSEIIKLLAESNIGMVMAKDSDGKTPLHIAIENNFESAVSTIINVVKKQSTKTLNLNILINAKDNDAQTCLHYAVKMGNLNIVEILLQNQANVNALDNSLMTPMHVLLKGDPTARKKNTTCSIVNRLLDAKADVTLIDSSNSKPHDYVANDHPIKQTLKNREKEISDKQRKQWGCIVS
jgi:ankyrin repeat protein